MGIFRNILAGIGIIAVGMSAHGVERTIESRTVGNVTLKCEQPGDWTFDLSVAESGEKEVITVKMSSPTPQVPPKFTVLMSMPQVDVHHLWCGLNEDRNHLRPDWGANYRTHLASEMPLYAFLNDGNENKLTIASNEPLRDVNATMGLREEGCMIVANLTYFNTPEAPIDRYETKILLDSRPVFWSDAVKEGAEWMTTEAGLSPVEAPAAAFEPLYSSWYQFHQDVSDKAIEEECRKAAAMGMKTIIVDDGWQTDDNNRGYGFCGDWEVSKNRFPDFASHVKKVQDTGMKYMLWYSVPFVGKYSKNYERFKGKYLRESDEIGVLDPRFPEVREFLCQTYEDAMRNYGLDGFKLDFIDQFTVSGKDKAIEEDYAGRDIKTVPEAVNVLMKEVYSRLKAINPEVLIEFRQRYVGPAIRQYGNMLRAADCPGDMRGNRERIANLRLTSGKTAVHADMLEWNAADTPESAARHILSAMFGVVQYSVMLKDLPDDHLRMLKHWIDFLDAHRKTLLESDFKAYHPQSGYPVIEAKSDEESIIAVYQNGCVATIDSDGKTYLINATGSDGVYVDCKGEGGLLDVYNVYGDKVASEGLAPGVSVIKIPVSGYAVLSR